jgi:hypothetical protein
MSLDSTRHRWVLALALASCVGVGMPAVADQNDPRLGPLITTLKTAPTMEAARPIEERISMRGQ